MKRKQRDDADYEIESLSKGIAVLEALEGMSFEPVSIEIIMQRSGFSRDFCTRALKTLRLRGYAQQLTDRRWTLGGKVIRFAQSVSAKQL